MQVIIGFPIIDNLVSLYFSLIGITFFFSLSLSPQAMAEDDLDFRQLLFKENPGKENVPPSPSLAPAAVATGGLASLDPPCKLEIDGAALCGGPEDGGLAGGQGSAGGRWDKSLGVLCQKFIMLFLVTPVSRGTFKPSQMKASWLLAHTAKNLWFKRQLYFCH